jgi:hypothetical protein
MYNKYNYLGPNTGGVETLMKLTPPTNELDEIAHEHDTFYLHASLNPEKADRLRLMREADLIFLERAQELQRKVESDLKKDEKERMYDAGFLSDVKKAKFVIQTKVDTGIDKLLDSMLSTAGVKVATDEKKKEIQAKVLEMANEQFKGEELTPDEIKILSGVEVDMADEQLRDLVEQAIKSHWSDEMKEGGRAREGKPSIHAPIPSDVKPLGSSIEKEPIGIEDIVKAIKTLNGTKTQEFLGIESKVLPSTGKTSLQPITGERNLRPLLMKGDYEGAVALNSEEKRNNRNFYANWKWVQSGYGNGNQQPLPDQIGVPFNNSILSAYHHNQELRYVDNYDAGAKEWHEQNAPYRVRPTPNTRAIFNVPMIPENQSRQAPTRNGALPAGVGRPIQMARDSVKGFDIFTPKQYKNSETTRLYNGDVVDGNRV